MAARLSNPLKSQLPRNIPFERLQLLQQPDLQVSVDHMSNLSKVLSFPGAMSPSAEPVSAPQGPG